MTEKHLLTLKKTIYKTNNTMTNEENKISDMIDAGLVIRESIEELAAKCFVMPKNKKGEAITTPVGANPKGWKAHLKSFTKGYLARADERENRWISVEENLPDANNKFNESEYVLGYDEMRNTVVVWYNSIECNWYVAHFLAKTEPLIITHWQPLPTPPKQ